MKYIRQVQQESINTENTDFCDFFKNQYFFCGSSEKALFFLNSAIQSLNSLKERKYTDFDALTTTNCCHGTSYKAWNCVSQLNSLDYEKYISEAYEVSRNFFEDSLSWCVPSALVEATSLYLLKKIRSTDSNVDRSDYYNLKELHSISKKQCRRIGKDLQTQFSNQVAGLYLEIKSLILEGNSEKADWGKYVSNAYLREDQRGRLYASCLFSMQVTLDRLSKEKALVAIVNDLYSSDMEEKGRYIQLLRGDGKNNFLPISVTQSLQFFSLSEPVVVFGGCAYNDALNLESLRFQMSPWTQKFAKLVLACDIHYPQFPQVSDDSNFDSSPIIPDEDTIRSLIKEAEEVSGVSATDPSLFCLNHVYLASLEQILRTFTAKSASNLPRSSIPSNLFS